MRVANTNTGLSSSSFTNLCEKWLARTTSQTSFQIYAGNTNSRYILLHIIYVSNPKTSKSLVSCLEQLPVASIPGKQRLVWRYSIIPGKVRYLARNLWSKPHIPGKIVPRNAQKQTSERVCVPGPLALLNKKPAAQEYNPLTLLSAAHQYNPLTLLSAAQQYNPLTLLSATQKYNPLTLLSVANQYNLLILLPATHQYNLIILLPAAHQYNPLTLLSAAHQYNPLTVLNKKSEYNQWLVLELLAC